MTGVGGLVLRRPAPGPRTALTVALVGAVGASLALADLENGLVHPAGGAAVGTLLRSLLTPELAPEFLLTVAEATALTLAYACAGMSVALLLGLPGALVVSGALLRRPALRAGTQAAARGGFALLRSVHELVWALVLVTVLGLTPLAGILAVGIPYGAAIARVLGERLQDVPQEPLTALRSAGASPTQVVLFGHLPMAAAGCFGYVAYRFECAIRAAAVLSFVGLGGIGYRMQIALADLRFGQVWTLVAALVVVITVMDRASGAVRARWTV